MYVDVQPHRYMNTNTLLPVRHTPLHSFPSSTQHLKHTGKHPPQPQSTDTPISKGTLAITHPSRKESKNHRTQLHIGTVPQQGSIPTNQTAPNQESLRKNPSNKALSRAPCRKQGQNPNPRPRIFSRTGRKEIQRRTRLQVRNAAVQGAKQGRTPNNTSRPRKDPNREGSRKVSNAVAGPEHCRAGCRVQGAK